MFSNGYLVIVTHFGGGPLWHWWWRTVVVTSGATGWLLLSLTIVRVAVVERGASSVIVLQAKASNG